MGFKIPGIGIFRGIEFLTKKPPTIIMHVQLNLVKTHQTRWSIFHHLCEPVMETRFRGRGHHDSARIVKCHFASSKISIKLKTECFFTLKKFNNGKGSD